MQRAIQLSFGVLLTTASLCATPVQGQVIASGQFELREGIQFKQFSFRHTVPLGLGSTTGRQLAVRLRDVTQPDRTCEIDHPLSGCATIDWPLPEGTVPLVDENFRNLVAVETANGLLEFHLRMDDGLSSQPEPVHPE